MRCCPLADGNTPSLVKGLAALGRVRVHDTYANTPFNALIPYARNKMPNGQCYPAYVTPPRSRPSASGLSLTAPAALERYDHYLPGSHRQLSVATESQEEYTPYVPLEALDISTPPILPSREAAGMTVEHSERAKMDLPINTMTGFGPLTPSPTGSNASGCSFAFSSVGLESPASTMALASPPTPRLAEFEKRLEDIHKFSISRS